MKFTIEDHEKKMRGILNQKPQESQSQNVLQSLLDKAGRKIKKPGEQQV